MTHFTTSQIFNASKWSESEQIQGCVCKRSSDGGLMQLLTFHDGLGYRVVDVFLCYVRLEYFVVNINLALEKHNRTQMNRNI